METVRFDELDLYPQVLRAIKEMGFEEATPIQSQAIPVVMSGVDVIGQAQTGTGKTASFGIPVLHKVDPNNKKTQVITPTLLGEMIFDVVNCSIRSLLNPELTASWEKGLTYVAEGSITPQEYMDKLEHFVRVRTNQVEQSNYQYALRQFFDAAAVNYQKKQTTSKRGGNT